MEGDGQLRIGTGTEKKIKEAYARNKMIFLDEVSPSLEDLHGAADRRI